MGPYSGSFARQLWVAREVSFTIFLAKLKNGFDTIEIDLVHGEVERMVAIANILTIQR